MQLSYTKIPHLIDRRNFVGKSAVLAAIQICLGANARRTHRARNLKDLVRRDASANMPTGAKIRVTLYNRGSDAYQHEVYGDTITVERTISLRAGGDNGYKLLDHNDTVRSKSKKDLDDMLDTLYVSFATIVIVSITQFFSVWLTIVKCIPLFCVETTTTTTTTTTYTTGTSKWTTQWRY